MPEIDLKKRLLEVFGVFAKEGARGVASFVADDFTCHHPRKPAMDLRGYQQHDELFRSQVSDLIFKLQRVVAEGNTVVVEFSDEATTTEGKKYQNRGVVIVDFDQEGKVRRMTEYVDTLAIVEGGIQGLLLEVQNNR